MENQDVMLYIRELETKLEEKVRLIQLYETMLEKFDSNLKLSIQSSHPQARTQALQKTITNKLFETLNKNLASIPDDTIKSMLEETHPATQNCVKLLIKGLQNETEPHNQLIIVTTSTFCKYMNEQEEIVLGNISSLFDQICCKVYDRCKPVITKLCDSTTSLLQNLEVTDSDYAKDNNRYSNIMMFHNIKFKSKMLKEILPMLK